MSLSAQQIEARDGKLTASRVACLMTGNPAKIMHLWQEMVGDPAFVPDDLSGVWPVQLGVATEALNLDWYERKSNRALSRRGEVVVHPEAGWAAATLDAWDAHYPGPVEAKHVGGREPLARVVERYQPQIHWQMIVTSATQAAISIIEGSNEPIVEIIPLDEGYAAELWRRAEAFMACVWSLRPPVALAPVSAPVKAERIVDMQGSNSWAEHAAAWLENIDGKRKADAAEKDLKGMVPADASKCHGHGVAITRNRAGSLSLRSAA